MIYILSQKEYEGADNLPAIIINTFKKTPNLDLYDALIFSSKNGVLALDKTKVNWKDIPSYSIGTGTSKAIKELGGKVVYSAKSSYGNDFAKEIEDKLSGKSVLFLRAKVVTSKLNKILKDAGVLLDELIIYETVCNKCKNLKKPESGSIIIFSSPSTIECFFSCFSWDQSYKAVVIGKVTASYMPENIDFVLSKEQNIPSCIKMAKSLSNNPL